MFMCTIRRQNALTFTSLIFYLLPRSFDFDYIFMYLHNVSRLNTNRSVLFGLAQMKEGQKKLITSMKKNIIINCGTFDEVFAPGSHIF